MGNFAFKKKYGTMLCEFGKGNKKKKKKIVFSLANVK